MDLNLMENISEEAIGQMLSDRYIIFQEAGLIEKTAADFSSTIGKLKLQDKAKKGFNSALQSSALALPLLAVGGGAALVKSYLNHSKANSLSAEADKVFKQISQASDVIKGDPETAKEALMALKSFAPSMAVRPIVQKTFIENVIRQGQLDPMTVKELADGENKIMGVKPKGGLKEVLTAPSDILKGISSTIGGKG